jgi:hypothetical protein
MITFQSLTQNIQADYVKEAKSKEILRALNAVIADINSKMPVVEKKYTIAESTVTGALTSSGGGTITGSNDQFENLEVGDHFNISGSVVSGEDDLDGDYTIVTKTSDNEVIVAETAPVGTSSTTTTVGYMYNSSVHITYDYSNETLEIVDPFIEVRDIMVDEDEYESVTDYVFENADSTDEYVRFLDRKTIEFLSGVTSSELIFRLVRQYDELSSTDDDIDLPDEFQQLLIYGVAKNLMMLPKYYGLYKDSVQGVASNYVSEFEARARHEYDRLPNRSIELEYKY